MPAPEPTNRPAPITPPRAIIDRWRCFRPWDREEPSAFGGVVTVVLDTRFVQCVDMGGTCGRIRRARGGGRGVSPGQGRRPGKTPTVWAPGRPRSGDRPRYGHPAHARYPPPDPPCGGVGRTPPARLAKPYSRRRPARVREASLPQRPASPRARCDPPTLSGAHQPRGPAFVER